MDRDAHFPAGVLLDYIENRAKAETMAQVAAHLEGGCARCAREVATWRRLLGALTAYGASAPPQAVRQRALDIFVPPTAESASSAPAVPAPRPTGRVPAMAPLLARLIFDSRVQPAPFGARDEVPSF